MITPWNWPINQIMVKIVPALATGCTSLRLTSPASMGRTKRLDDQVVPGVDPSEVGLRPFGEDNIPVSPEVAIGSDPVHEALNALRRGARSIDFWLLAGSFFVCGASTNGTTASG